MSSKRRLVRPVATALLIACGALVGGCAASVQPPPIMSNATLGQVIIYRNGVAYFVRYAAPGDKELTLRVPAERVDDFLKSLTVVDEKTQETMPVSYPTLHRIGDEVEMIIELPAKHNRLKISYVTESPAWKPSYRLVLGEKGKARLQGWAVVDNVSGEDWKDVRVGVGSTSALSFRYDMHSVKSIQRETLSAGSLLAVAPPTGGTPYAAGDKANVVVVNLPQGSLAQMDNDDDAKSQGEFKKKDALEEQPIAGNVTTEKGRGRGHRGGGKVGTATKPTEKPPVPDYAYLPPTPPPSAATQTVDGLKVRLQNNRNEKVRIEGYASSGDGDPQNASWERANKLRDRLIAQGVDPAQVEAVGTGQVNDAQEITVTVDEQDAEGKETGGAAAAPEEVQPVGQAHFVSSTAMTIAKDHSAMVSILQDETPAERVYYYDPISERGSKKFAFNAVRLKNPSQYTLDSGPITVYLGNQFLGEGMAEPILPHGTSFVPYALDRAVIVEPEESQREEIDRLVTIQRGVVTTETRLIRSTKLVLTNRGTDDATIYVRHKVAAGYQLSTRGPKTEAPEKLGGAHLFKVAAKGGESVALVIDEWTPVSRSVDIRTDEGIEAMALYLGGASLTPELKSGLADIVAKHTARANIEEKILTLEEQTEVYRARVDEINVQLVTLKKLPQGEKLRSHLASKMQEISEKLQATTLQLADLKAELMASRIDLQDKLAELSLKDERDDNPELAKKE
jgi:hypothetical protein